MNKKKENEVFFQSDDLAVPEIFIEDEVESEAAEDAVVENEKEKSEGNEPHVVFDNLAIPEVDFSKSDED